MLVKLNVAATDASQHTPVFTPEGDNLFFISGQGFNAKWLWMTDGTPSGTKPVINNTTISGAIIEKILNFNNKIYVATRNKLYSVNSDGTGLSLVATMSTYSDMAVANNKLFVHHIPS